VCASVSMQKLNKQSMANGAQLADTQTKKGICRGRGNCPRLVGGCFGEKLTREKMSGRNVHGQCLETSATVTTCDTLVNTQTHRQLLAGYTISSASLN